MLKLGVRVVNLDLPLINLISGEDRRLASAKQAPDLLATIDPAIGRLCHCDSEPFRVEHGCALFL